MKKIYKIGFFGLITGFINGLFGSGGGTILVPILQKYFDIGPHKSHATAIAIILPLSVLSAFLYIRAFSVDWNTVLYVSIGGLIGGYAGANFLKKLSGNLLHKIFGIFMIISALRMIL